MKTIMKGNIMKNNKNRIRDREKSNSELRKMEPKDNADIGMINGQIIGVHEGGNEKRRSEIKSKKD
jgi:hypothetical protein